MRLSVDPTRLKRSQAPQRGGVPPQAPREPQSCQPAERPELKADDASKPGATEQDPQMGPERRPWEDQVQVSPESREAQSVGEPDVVPGLKDNFGPVNLENPSADVEKDCGEILGALGEGIPGDLELGTTMSAVPLGGGRLLGARTGSLALEDVVPALQSLESHAEQATASYGGKLPPKVQAHLEQARAAAARAGLP